MRGFLTTVVFLAPPSRVKNAVLRLLGHDVARTARILPNIVVGVGQISVGAGASLGHFNVFRGLREIRLAENALIGQLNWFSTAPEFVAMSENSGRLILEESASVVSRHHVDCAGGVILRRFANLAGMNSIVLTHALNFADNRQECAPVEIGEYSLVNAANRLVPGAVVPPYSVTGIATVILPGLVEPARLYAGSPARDVKSVAGGKLFHRDQAITTT